MLSFLMTTEFFLIYIVFFLLAYDLFKSVFLIFFTYFENIPDIFLVLFSNLILQSLKLAILRNILHILDHFIYIETSFVLFSVNYMVCL